MESIRLNNIAVSMVCSGEYEASLAYFQHALTTLRTCVASSSERSDIDDLHNDMMIKDIDMSESEPSLDIRAVQHDFGGKIAAKGHDYVEGAFVYHDKVFMISFDDSSCCRAELERVQNMVLAVVTYNLGNVSHKMAIESGKAWQFARAMNFYELCFSAIEKLLLEFDFDNNLILLLCCLYNNMGHIHARSNDVEETQSCLTWLQKTVGSDEFDSCTSMCDDDYCFFSLYLMFCDPQKDFSSAPAA